MAGSNHGLSEISHTGQMRQVGGKAAGFIHKKFFHPSSMRNQEKIWQAYEASAGEERKQIELCKRREEELAVERMKKQMYLNGQGSKEDSALFAKDGDNADDEQLKEAQEAAAEQRRRKAMLKEQGMRKDESDDEDRELARSCYEEDVFSNGHWTVWGSWYDREKERWGFRCCRSLSQEGECPNAADAPAPKLPTKSRRKMVDQSESSGAKRSKTDVEEKREDEKAREEYEFQLQVQGTRDLFIQKKEPEKLDPYKYMAPELLQAVSRKEEAKKKKAAEEAKPKDEGSDYLADLLSDPLAL